MMKSGNIFTRYLIAFCVITTALCVMEGILGALLLPDMSLQFKHYLVPPAFGLLTSLTGLVMESRKELSVRQMLARMAIQLLLIEGIVFGVNIAIGNRFSPLMALVVAFENAVIFVFVYFVMWLNEHRIANAFNSRLSAWQHDEELKK